MNRTLDLAMDLIRRPSVTPDDAGCQAALAERLTGAGFAVENLPFGEVSNLWARHGKDSPVLLLLGHTDVVPPGPDSAWTSPPFEPQVRDGVLYGRGAADMKGAVASMVTACERFVARHPGHAGSVAILMTSDEEGPAVDGTVRVMETLHRRGERVRWCLVGEPTSETVLGDVIKNGRRGSLSGYLKVRGIQGHVAYPHLGDNPVHRFAPALAALGLEVWDTGSEHFPPTTFQVSNLRAGTGAENVIPGLLEAWFNFRHSTAVTQAQLRERVGTILDRHQLSYDLDWRSSGEPFLTEPGELVDAVRESTREITGREPLLSTAGGTSDGRFLAPHGVQVVEFGPSNATAHKVDERVEVQDLEKLSRIYERVLERLLGGELSGRS